MEASPLRPIAGYGTRPIAQKDPIVQLILTKRAIASVYNHIIDQARRLGASLNRDR